MGLIKCSECNNEVSSKASSCPKCGAPIAIDNASSSEVTGEAQVTIQETSKVFKLHTIY
ncbi:MAG: zinc ribbon domain-containing protein, partial [Candidatus Thioglobus sp.]|nr:zinc ribbon domain-containing protein [Candidatus Thioglobus sp.]